MLSRPFARQALLTELAEVPCVGLVGARQVGKTTLAKQIAAELDSPVRYLDLQLPSARRLLTDAEAYLRRQAGELVILDEVQTFPEVFPTLRGLIDEDRRAGRFLILGSAAPELLRATSESLAGRISYLELGPLNVRELGSNVDVQTHWLRGGYPEAYLQDAPERRLRYFDNYLQTFVGTDLRDLAGGTDPEGMRRLVVMIAHSHGNLLNQSHLARSLGVATTTVQRYLDILAAAFLTRTVRPYLPNLRKRLRKAPKVYLRDSGFVHGLLGIGTEEELLAHPASGASWEGYVAEQLRAVIGERGELLHYRSARGHELDFVCDHRTRGLLAFEVKRSNAPSLSSSFWTAVADCRPAQTFVVSPDVERHPLGEAVEGIGLREVVAWLARESA